GVGEAPFALQAAHFATPFHGVWTGCQRLLGRFGEFLGITDQAGDKRTIGAKDLYAVVGPVAHIHIALRIDGHISRTVQLALAGAITAAKLYQEITLWGELLHPVVLMVGDVHITLVVYRNTPGGIELPRGAAEATPGAEEFAVFGDLLYTVVAAINDIQDVLLVDSNPRGAI